ncbi:MAG: hypothetical protein PHN38_09700 [Sulfurospirillaceae bacterium]|nr:hypothetical protein [Sulfurospirillaceae bacterium]
MTKNEDIEQALLSNKSLEELIKEKVQQEIDAEIVAASGSRKPREITKFSELPKDKIFADSAVYSLFNRATKQRALINGSQVECLIGIDNSLREKLTSHQVDTFLVEDYYVKFHHASI